MNIDKITLTVVITITVIFNLHSSIAMALDPLMSAINISSSALRAQSERLKIISQNIANENSTGTTPGSLPYKRKIIFFKSKKDPKNKEEKIDITKIGVDNKTKYRKEYDPSHPAANNEGYVLYPNVNKQVEFVDAKEAQRSFDANLNVIDISNAMLSKTLEILR